MNLRCVTAAALCALSLPAAGETLDTGIGVLVGVAGEAAAPALTPGAEITLDEEKERLMPGSREQAALESRMIEVARKVRQALGLAAVRVYHSLSLPLAVDGEIFMPPLAGPDSVRPYLTLLGFDERAASYRVEVRGGEAPFDVRVDVERGLPAVFAVDPEARVYMVLALPPVPPGAGPVQPGDVLPPRILSRSDPIYTVEARKAKVQGVVIVQAIIEADGSVGEVKVLRGLPEGLSESAVAAVRRFRFAPATLDGEPVRVHYNLTINFRLQKKKKR